MIKKNLLIMLLAFAAIIQITASTINLTFNVTGINGPNSSYWVVDTNNSSFSNKALQSGYWKTQTLTMSNYNAGDSLVLSPNTPFTISGAISIPASTDWTYDFDWNNVVLTPHSPIPPVPTQLKVVPLQAATPMNQVVTQDLTQGVTGGSTPYNITITGQPAHGSYAQNGTTVIYTPSNGFYGTDSISYNVTDSSKPVQTAPNTLTITVAAPSPLVVNNYNWSINAGTASSECSLISNNIISGGIQPYAINIDSNMPTDKWSFDSTKYSITVTNPTEGNYTFNLSVKDSLGNSASGKVSLTVAQKPANNILSFSFGSGAWYSSVQTTIKNFTVVPISSVQLTIAPNILSGTSTQNLSWDSPTTVIQNSDGSITLSCQLSSVVKTGESLTLNAGLNLTGKGISQSDIVSESINNIGSFGFADINPTINDSKVTMLSANIDDTAYPLIENSHNIIPLPLGSHSVYINNAFIPTDITHMYSPSQSTYNITISSDVTDTISPSFFLQSIIPTTIQVGINGKDDIQANAQVILGSQTDYIIYSNVLVQSKQSVAVSVPSNVPYTLVFANSKSGNGYYPSAIYVPSASITSSQYNATYNPISINVVKAGYLDCGINPIVSLPEAVSHGYNLIYCAFGDITQNSDNSYTVIIPVYLGQNISSTGPQLISDIKTIHTENARALLSFGGENNAFHNMTGNINPTTLASAIIKCVNQYGFDGIDFDIENSCNSFTSDTFCQLLVDLKQLQPNIVISIAPQLVKGIYGWVFAIPAGGDSSLSALMYKESLLTPNLIDYVFMQDYCETGTVINGYAQENPNFINASFQVGKTLLSGNTRLIIGEPANKAAATSSIFYNGNTDKENYILIYQQISQLFADPQFGGVGDWSVNHDKEDPTVWQFSTNIFW